MQRSVTYNRYACLPLIKLPLSFLIPFSPPPRLARIFFSLDLFISPFPLWFALPSSAADLLDLYHRPRSPAAQKNAHACIPICAGLSREGERADEGSSVGDVFSFSRHGRCSELLSLSTRFFLVPPLPHYFSPRALVDRCLPSHFSDGPHIFGINYLLVSPSSKLLFLCACSSLPVPLLNGACICRTAAWTLSVGALFHLFTPLNMLYRPSPPSRPSICFVVSLACLS